MNTRTLDAGDPTALTHAGDVLSLHGLVAFPTDTVYGLAAGAFDSIGIDRLYSVKGRAHTKAIAVLLASADQLPHVAVDFPERAALAANAFWPGPLTLVVPRHPDVPSSLSKSNTLGVRVPDHPVALHLLQKAGPLAVTSANLSGQENTCTAEEVYGQLGGRIDLILDGGRTPGGVPSTVIDCTTTELRVLREGPIPLEAILKVIQGNEGGDLI